LGPLGFVIWKSGRGPYALDMTPVKGIRLKLGFVQNQGGYDGSIPPGRQPMNLILVPNDSFESS